MSLNSPDFGSHPETGAETAFLATFEALPTADAQRTWFRDRLLGWNDLAGHHDGVRETMAKSRLPDGTLPDNWFTRNIATQGMGGRINLFRAIQMLVSSEETGAGRGKEFMSEEIQSVWAALSARARIDSVSNENENSTRKNVDAIQKCISEAGLNSRHLEYIVKTMETTRGSGITGADAIESLENSVELDADGRAHPGSYNVAKTGISVEQLHVLDAANDIYWLSGRANEINAPESETRTSVLGGILAVDRTILDRALSAWSKTKKKFVSSGITNLLHESFDPLRNHVIDPTNPNNILAGRNPEWYRAHRLRAADLKQPGFHVKDINAYYTELSKTSDMSKLWLTWLNSRKGWGDAAVFYRNPEDKNPNILGHLYSVYPVRSRLIAKMVDIALEYRQQKEGTGFNSKTHCQAEMIERNPAVDKDTIMKDHFRSDDLNLWEFWLINFARVLTPQDLTLLADKHCPSLKFDRIKRDIGKFAGYAGSVASSAKEKLPPAFSSK